jgi:hypothetical protein
VKRSSRRGIRVPSARAQNTAAMRISGSRRHHFSTKCARSARSAPAHLRRQQSRQQQVARRRHGVVGLPGVRVLVSRR